MTQEPLPNAITSCPAHISVIFFSTPIRLSKELNKWRCYGYWLSPCCCCCCFRMVWFCIQCKTEYDIQEIEQSLIDAVNRTSMAYVLQDLKCGKCQGVSLALFCSVVETNAAVMLSKPPDHEKLTSLWIYSVGQFTAVSFSFFLKNGVQIKLQKLVGQR